MKQLFTCCIIAFSLTIFAQTPITLLRTDFPFPPNSSATSENIDYTDVTNFLTNTQNNTGINYNWNEANLIGTLNNYLYLPISDNSVPISIQNQFFNSVYCIDLINDQKFANGTISDPYEIFSNGGNTKLYSDGFFGMFNFPNLPIQNIFNGPISYYPSKDVVYKFPIAFGNTDSSIVQCFFPPMNLSNYIISFKRDQKRVNEVDGWGQITLPSGTFDVLRMKTTIHRIDSVTINNSIINLSDTNGTDRTLIDYKWLAKNLKIPALQISGYDSSGIFIQTATKFYGQYIPANVSNTIKNISSITFYPNPITNLCTINFELKKEATVDIDIFSIFGQKVAEFHFNKQAGYYSETIPLQQLQNGNYILKCSANNEVLTTNLSKLLE